MATLIQRWTSRVWTRHPRREVVLAGVEAIWVIYDRASRASRSFHRWTRSTVHDRGVNLACTSRIRVFAPNSRKTVSARWRYSIAAACPASRLPIWTTTPDLHAKVVRLCNDEGLAVLFGGLLDAPTVFVYFSKEDADFYGRQNIAALCSASTALE